MCFLDVHCPSPISTSPFPLILALKHHLFPTLQYFGMTISSVVYDSRSKLPPSETVHHLKHNEESCVSFVTLDPSNLSILKPCIMFSYILPPLMF